MTAPRTKTVTDLLAAVSEGNESAQDRLWSLVYEELRRLARGQLAAEAPGHTLQTTSLVHEAYLRLVGDQDVQWANRCHFFGAAAQAMRRIRIDDARRRHRLKRGGGYRRIPLDQVGVAFDDNPENMLAIDEALTRLEERDPRKAEIVKLRFFAGLTVDETAKALSLSTRTIESEWRFARAWLHRELRTGDSDITASREPQDD